MTIYHSYSFITHHVLFVFISTSLLLSFLPSATNAFNLNNNNDTPDYYSILGLTKSATANEIKSAYRRLAVKWHPDKNPRNVERATKKFEEIANAYEVLGDEQQRRRYDSGGVFNFGGFPGFGFDFGGGNHHRHSFSDPMEMFEDFFGTDFGDSQFDFNLNNFGFDSDFESIFGGKNGRPKKKSGSIFGADLFGNKRRRTHSSSSTFSSSSYNFNGGGGNFMSSSESTTYDKEGRRIKTKSMSVNGAEITEKYIDEQLIERLVNGVKQPLHGIENGKQEV